MGVVKYSGPIASFHCPTEATIRSLKVHFSPKQLGEGTPSPENIRSIEGWDGVIVQHYDDIYGVPLEYQRVEYIRIRTNSYFDSNYVPTVAPKIITKIKIMANNDADLFGFANNVVPSFIVNPTNYGSTWYERWGATNYTTMSKQVLKPTVCEFGKNQIIDGTLLKTFPDTDWSINTQTIRVGGARNINSDMNLYYCDIYDGTNLVRRLIPCRRINDGILGLYDDVNNNFYINQGSGTLECGPDVGKTVEYEFGVLGKNKLDKNSYKYLNSSMICFGGDSSAEPDGSLFLKAGTYTFSVSTTAYIIFASDANKKNIASATNTNTITFTLPESIAIRIGCFVQDATDEEMLSYNYQLELGSTATTYEPYDPNKTVYGGWVDLVSGEVCEEYYKWIITPDNFTLNNVYTGGICFEKVLNTIPRPNGVMVEQKFTHGTVINPYGGNTGCNAWAYSAGGSKVRIGFSDSYNLSSVEDFYNWLNLQTDEVAITYKTNTPNTYNIAPIALKTFLSQNNIWSNADYVEVEYDLHETQNILARKQFIIANQPHVEKLAAAPLQNFVTDMAAPLKECKVYFEPKQDLHGYDHPWVGGTGKNLFNYLDPENWRIATTPTARWKEHTEGTITNSNGTVVLSRNTSAGGLALILGELVAETQYTIFGIFTNIDNTAYIAKLDTAIADDYTCTRVTTPKFVDGAVSFTPTENGIYELLLWIGGNGDISARNVQLEKGSTATAYEPWENICPIERTNAIELYKAGENLIPSDYEAVEGKWEPTNGIISSSVYPMGQFPVPSSIIRYQAETKGITYFGLMDGPIQTDEPVYDVATITNRIGWTIDNAAGHKYALLTANYDAIYSNKVVISVGSEFKDYSEPSGITIPITFPPVINVLTLTKTTANQTLSSAGEAISESGMSVTDYIKVSEGSTYTLKFTSKEGARTRRIWSYNANKEPIEQLASISWATVDVESSIQATIPSDAEYIRVCYKTADENIFLEGPESQVIYGGYVDLIKGEMVAKYSSLDLSTITDWVSWGDGNYRSGKIADMKNISWVAYPDNSLFTEQYKIVRPYDIQYHGAIGIGGYQNTICSSVENPTGIIVYKLAEPIHHSINPQTLKTLRGTNNIWSNSNGDITIQFWRH